MRRDDDVRRAAAAARRTAPATKTSIAAPATLPDSSAATSASSSTSSPRAALTIRTPSRIFAIAAASIAPRVSSVSGRCSVRKSARASTSSNDRALDAELAEALGGDERVVRDDLHLQAERAARDLAADPAEAEHAEHLVGELDPAPLRALPAAVDERRVRLRDVARERERAARSCARPPRRRSTRARSRRRSRAASPHRRRRCRRRRRRGRSPSAASRAAITSAVTFVAERTISAS